MRGRREFLSIARWVSRGPVAKRNEVKLTVMFRRRQPSFSGSCPPRPPRLAALPGAQRVATTSNTPGSGTSSHRFEIAGQPIPEHVRRPTASPITAGSGYYRLLGMNLIQGREFDTADGRPGKESVIVSHEFATKFFPRQHPHGQKFRFFDQNRKPRESLTIVGIAPDIRQSDPGRPRQGPVVAQPYNWEAQGGMAVLIRTTGNATALASALRQQVQQIDGDLPLFDVGTLDENLQRGRWHLGVFSTLFLVFVLIALGMATVGIYAVMAHATTQRTREIGVRLALGAGTGAIVRMVLHRGLPQIGIGLTLGLTAAFFLSRLMAGLLLKVSPSDPIPFGFVGLTLFSAGLAACLIPARRAARLDPLNASRHH